MLLFFRFGMIEISLEKPSRAYEESLSFDLWNESERYSPLPQVINHHGTVRRRAGPLLAYAVDRVERARYGRSLGVCWFVWLVSLRRYGFPVGTVR